MYIVAFHFALIAKKKKERKKEKKKRGGGERGQGKIRLWCEFKYGDIPRNSNIWALSTLVAYYKTIQLWDWISTVLKVVSKVTSL